MTREEIPDIHGSKWALKVIPDVVETIGMNSALSKAEQRLLLEERFRKYIRKPATDGKTEKASCFGIAKGSCLRLRMRSDIIYTGLGLISSQCQRA